MSPSNFGLPACPNPLPVGSNHRSPEATGTDGAARCSLPLSAGATFSDTGGAGFVPASAGHDGEAMFRIV